VANVPVPVVLTERRRGPLVLESFMATTAVPGRPLREECAQLASPEARRGLLEAVGRWVRGVHRAGLFHGDLTAENLLVRRTADGWEPGLVDLLRSRLRRRPSPADRAEELAPLLRTLQRAGVDAGGQRRLLEAYAAPGPDRTAELDVADLGRRIAAVEARYQRHRQVKRERGLSRQDAAER
jgi:tRNA A-37 threonylcarbamoyl transferase component Bud32